MAELYQSSNHQAKGDREVFTGAGTGGELVEQKGHNLDDEKSRETLKKLLTWYYLERDLQAPNRLDMAIDNDFYDNLQWDPDDAADLRGRGQMTLVFNEVAPMVDWLIGTERRARVDWKVLPRLEKDVEVADVKTKVLKYVSDINRVQSNRSRAFADAVKVGVGWLDDGVRDDPTKDPAYSKYEDWRNVLWDSASYDLDLEDARYVFRWRWVDEDIAVMMFPDRADQIRQGVHDANYSNGTTPEEETWRTAGDLDQYINKGTLIASGAGIAIDAKRRRVKLIECQYRMPVKVKIVNSGPFKGAIFNDQDGAIMDSLQQGGSIIDKTMMRVCVAVFTEAHMLSMNTSIFRHNKFSLTPVWCYRRGRDRMPYGAIRRVRDLQQDLNKRASKALFLLNTNQIIAEKGAVADTNLAREEADRPDGYIEVAVGKKFDIRRDTDQATGQLQLMAMDAQNIQKSAGVAQENMGRATNAVSGEAIKARQIQGSVVTTEPFDNLGLATQIQGEKQLSIVEQFYTEEKVIRLTGSRGALDWVRINQPEEQPDGSFRYINDITASMADFQVSEQDYAGTLRQVMFDSLNQMAQRLPPEISMRLLTIAMEFSDLPNKDEIAQEFRKLTGERDPNKQMTPEEMQQQEEQMKQQTEAMQMAREQAMTALEEGRGKVREINARALKLEAEAQAVGSAGGGEMDQALAQVRSQAAAQIDELSKQLVKVQNELANRTLQINKEADTKLSYARIESDGRARVAEIQAASDKQISALERRLDDMARTVNEAQSAAEQARKAATDAPPASKEAAPAATPAAALPPITLNIAVDAKPAGKKTIEFKTDADGMPIGAEVTGD